MRGWLTPDTLTPNAAHVRRLVIPGDRVMLANVCGALLDMTYETSWEQQGAVTPAEAAQASLDMYGRFLVETWSMIGAIVPAITADTPVGCLELDGATYNGDDYPDLYAVIDSFWKNGDGTFTVPDLRGKFPLSLNGSHGMGATGGAETITLTEAQMPAHTHGESTAVPAVINGGVEAPAAAATPSTGVTGSAGSSQAHDNMPPFVALRYVLIAW